MIIWIRFFFNKCVYVLNVVIFALLFVFQKMMMRKISRVLTCLVHLIELPIL